MGQGVFEERKDNCLNELQLKYLALENSENSCDYENTWIESLLQTWKSPESIGSCQLKLIFPSGISSEISLSFSLHLPVFSSLLPLSLTAFPTLCQLLSLEDSSRHLAFPEVCETPWELQLWSLSHVGEVTIMIPSAKWATIKIPREKHFP